MKVEKTTVLAAAGIGLAIYFFMQNQRQQQLLQQRIAQDLANKNLAQPRSQAAQDVMSWTQAILAIYGNISALWQPGGVFYRLPNSVKQQLASQGVIIPKFN